MVGDTGRLPVGMDKVTRVKAVNNQGFVIKREMDLFPRRDGEPWVVGQVVALDDETKLWREFIDGDAVIATITEVVG